MKEPEDKHFDPSKPIKPEGSWMYEEDTVEDEEDIIRFQKFCDNQGNNRYPKDV